MKPKNPWRSRIVSPKNYPFSYRPFKKRNIVFQEVKIIISLEI